VAQTLAVDGGNVWFADETTLREFPPLRSRWARRGEQAVVTISGKNSRRVLHGAINVVTGEAGAEGRVQSLNVGCVDHRRLLPLRRDQKRRCPSGVFAVALPLRQRLELCHHDASSSIVCIA
jgi:hypothetical protein